MRTVTTYLADDGESFETREACEAHEASGFARKFVGLTLEQVEAALTRTDVKLADAFEVIGGRIAETRRQSGEKRRRTKGSAEIAQSSGGAELSDAAKTASLEPGLSSSTAGSLDDRPTSAAFEKGRQAFRDGKPEMIPGGLREHEWDDWSAGYASEAGRGELVPEERGVSAIFSPCGLYRLRLDRVLDMLGGITVGFCLHNPSTAGEEANDPTSCRGIGYATAWRASRLIFVNPWAGIATKPADLWRMADPVGPENDQHIVEAAREVQASGGFMLMAWGAVSPPAALRGAARARLAQVEALIRSECADVRALGVNADGSPKHPLYLRGDALPRRWPESWRDAA